MRARLYTTTALCAFMAAFSSGQALAASSSSDDLLSLSLEQLTNISVTSVSKKDEKASEAAAAIFVITANDISRLGATSIPEALRIVPGLNVAQAGSSQWSVTSRGFNGQFANKLLVLIDGRTVYTPLFSGVFWDVQDVMLEDIERIEVIRGPGATLWGANAVNGIINIITKSAKDTEGGLVTAGAGNYETAFGAARYGTKIGDSGYVRAYAKYNNRDSARTLADDDAQDGWRKSQFGMRADWENQEKSDKFTLQGDVYTGNEDVPFFVPSLVTPPASQLNDSTDLMGGNILGRWNRSFSEDSQTSLQVYFDNAQRRNTLPDNNINTVDVDFQHVWSGIQSNEIIWGLGYRSVHFDIKNTEFYTQLPNSQTDSLFSAFLQDKITVLPEKLYLTLGSKFEQNEYTGFEVQPSARFSWLVSEGQTVWGAVGRAVRVPNFSTDGGLLSLSPFPLSGPPFGFIGTQGNSSLKSEVLWSYELGYRVQPTENTSLDIATFYNDHNRQVLGEVGTPFVRSFNGGAPFLYVPITPVNTGEVDSYGIEIAANWRVTDNWQLSSSYTWQDFDIKTFDLPGFLLSGNKSPEQQFNIRSTLELPYSLEMDNALYYVDSVRGASIADYIRFDTRIAWKPMDGIELSLVGQNLFDDTHPEFTPFVYQQPTQVGRSVYGQVTWRF